MKDSIIHFESDYMEGCHPKILEKIAQINFQKQVGYGQDDFCQSAKQKIKDSLGKFGKDAEVHFLVGGTQTNSTVISCVLKPWQGVVSAKSGHIAVHEAGAVEYTGHKVMEIGHKDGKIQAEELQKYLQTFKDDGNNTHMVEPGMVYISHPTEYGTLYTKNELKNISSVCKKYDIPLFLDGARLGYALASFETDVTLQTIGEFCDIFYIGGTKVGAMFGEAVVITKKDLIPHFFTMIKQHGALLAKGFLLGVQFDALFSDNLYFEISKNAIETAMYLKQKMLEKGYKLYLDSPTNQQFFIVENEKLKKWDAKVGYCFIEKYDSTHTVVRFATSWATKTDDVERLIENLE